MNESMYAIIVVLNLLKGAPDFEYDEFEAVQEDMLEQVEDDVAPQGAQPSLQTICCCYSWENHGYHYNWQRVIAGGFCGPDLHGACVPFDRCGNNF